MTSWLIDSSATHHLTSDLNNLALHQPYNGGEEVSVVDSSTMSITHMGSISIPTLSKPVTLDNVLCAPAVNKNLISVYRLCNANKVSVEFFPAQVKDLRSGARLLQGQTKGELYEWPKPNHNPSAYATYPDTKATLNRWHNRLGHPSLSTLKFVVSKFSLPCPNTTFSFPCNDCLLNKTHKLSFQQSSITSSIPLQYLFTDVWQSPISSPQN